MKRKKDKTMINPGVAMDNQCRICGCQATNQITEHPATSDRDLWLCDNCLTKLVGL